MSLEKDQTLRERQIVALERMLNLNIDNNLTDLTSAQNTEEIIWKVLILDSRSQGIVSSVLRVNDLLRCGITMHSLINSKRSPLPDVPVIYFVEPSVENMSKIIEDLTNDTYDTFYINFTSNINRDLLEEFAKKVAISGKSSKIVQVFDQYLDFIVTEPELFSLDFPNVYSSLNNRNVQEDTITTIVEQIAQGLYSSIITTGSIPIIRCARGGPAEYIASSLDSKLRDHVINTRSHLNNNNLQKSVLILLDRNFDLASMFSHSWIYQCMVSDILTLKRNNITVKTNDKGKISIKKYDIDPADFFWNKNSHLPFPDAVENVEEELANYKKEAQELTDRTGITSLNDIDPSSADTSHIQQAVNALPELTARKSIIDMHMNVLASLLSQLQSKSLDKFFEIEQNYNDSKIQAEFLEIISTPATSEEDEKNNNEDKLRTFLILNLLTELPKEFTSKCEEVLAEQKIDLSSLKYIRRVKDVIKLSQMSSTLNESPSATSRLTTTNNNSDLFGSLSSKLYGLADGRISEGVGSLIGSFKKYLPAKQQLPITNIVESIMDPTSAASNILFVTDDYLYFDPSATRGVHSKQPKRQSYAQGTVFVVGGGNYLEYQNLQEWAKNPSKNKKVVYGTTDITTASKFLKECAELGS